MSQGAAQALKTVGAYTRIANDAVTDHGVTWQTLAIELQAILLVRNVTSSTHGPHARV